MYYIQALWRKVVPMECFVRFYEKGELMSALIFVPKPGETIALGNNDMVVERLPCGIIAIIRISARSELSDYITGVFEQIMEEEDIWLKKAHEDPASPVFVYTGGSKGLARVIANALLPL